MKQALKFWSLLIFIRLMGLAGDRHESRTAKLARDLCLQCKLPREMTTKIYRGAMLHDIGKIAVSQNILISPHPLTEASMAIVRTHPIISERILRALGFDIVILRIARHHHSRFDGSGYPDKLSGMNIPIGARILAVVDSYDAMTNARVYKPTMTKDEALDELERGAGVLYDPYIVEKFIGLMNDN